MTHLVSSPAELAPHVIERWGAMLGSRAAAEKLTNSGRLHDRVMKRLFDIHDVPTAVNEADAHRIDCVRIVKAAGSDFRKLCGLIFYGSKIRACISQHAFLELKDEFGHQELKFAASQIDVAPGADDTKIQADQFGRSVARAGEMCVQLWQLSLPDHIQKQLRMTGQIIEPSFDNQISIDPRVAVTIVNRAAKYFDHKSY